MIKYLLAFFMFAVSAIAQADEFTFLKTEEVEKCSHDKWCKDEIGRLDNSENVYYATVYFSKDLQDYGPHLYVYKKVKAGYQLVARSLSLNPHARVSWQSRIEKKSIFFGFSNSDNISDTKMVFHFKKYAEKLRLIGVEEFHVSGLPEGNESYKPSCEHSEKSVNLLSGKVIYHKKISNGILKYREDSNFWKLDKMCPAGALKRYEKVFDFKSPKVWLLEDFSYDYEPLKKGDFHDWYIHDKKVCGYINDKNKYDVKYCE